MSIYFCTQEQRALNKTRQLQSPTNRGKRRASGGTLFNLKKNCLFFLIELVHALVLQRDAVAKTVATAARRDNRCNRRNRRVERGPLDAHLAVGCARPQRVAEVGRRRKQDVTALLRGRLVPDALVRRKDGPRWLLPPGSPSKVVAALAAVAAVATFAVMATVMTTVMPPTASSTSSTAAHLVSRVVKKESSSDESCAPNVG